ncbi:hypothetical protein DID88_008168 [Monilinia fructigena]|uniref:Uncharacterized protein n=1 Tax=Monilinia fructigena TaxID=38457 RepID=A0A395J6Y4_9HELO|nr:hypothetical protein DID88_008168 [Monilinia fructigena]
MKLGLCLGVISEDWRTHSFSNLLHFLTILKSKTLFLSRSNVQAGRITYTCYNKTGGVKKDGLLEQKAGGNIPDDQEKVIVEGMHSWSNGKYTASVNKLTKIVVVKCHEKAATKDAATKAINEQEQLVNSHIKKTKRDNDDDSVGDDNVDDNVYDDINDDIDSASDDDVPEYAF